MNSFAAVRMETGRLKLSFSSSDAVAYQSPSAHIEIRPRRTMSMLPSKPRSEVTDRLSRCWIAPSTHVQA